MAKIPALSQFLKSLGGGNEPSQDWLLAVFLPAHTLPSAWSSFGEAIPCLAEFSNKPSNNNTKTKQKKAAIRIIKK